MKCKPCEGTGKIRCGDCDGEGIAYGHAKCLTCQGVGLVDCSHCGATGKVKLLQWKKSG